MKLQLKRKPNIFLRVAVAALMVYVIISLIQLQLDINDKRSVLSDLSSQIASQQRLNEELSSENADDDLYLDQQARNKGLAKPGESIYKEVPGN